MIDSLRSALLAPALLLTLAAPSSTVDDEIAKGDRRKIVKAIAEYFEADDEDRLEAQEELAELLSKIDEDLDSPVLAHVDDVQSMLLEARERESRVDGKGSAEEVAINLGALEAKAVVRAPKKYKPDEAYPLVLVIPDEGVTPEEALRLDWVQPEAVETAVFCAVMMPSDLSVWGSFGENNDGGVYPLMISLGHMLNNYSIHPDRVILAARGAGVAAAAEIAATLPDRFAAVVGVAGDLGETPIYNFGAISTLWIGGGPRVTEFDEAARKAGRENVRVEPNLEPDEIWTWVSEQRRNAHPLEVTFRPRAAQARDAYWLSVDGLDETVEGAGVAASIDRDANTISIDGKGINKVTLLFNDALVDLSRPVKVVINGVENERSLTRGLKFMLERVKRAGDPRRIYVTSGSYDVAAASE
ncbi:MAG: hypothetical protein AAFZ65_02490 [Planctomycetota bacterium]